MDAAQADPRRVDEDAATWETPPRRPPDLSAAPVLSVEGFEGPLDWLVELARARRIDLQKISIVALIAAFEAAMLDALAPQAAAPTLARWGDWLVMAADLTVLRSRLLLPADAAETRDAEAHGEALRRLLVGRTAISVAADWLDRRTQLGRNVFARGRSDAASPAQRGRAGDVTGLLRACLVALALPAEAGAAYRAPAKPFWTTTDAVARIRAWLPTPGEAGCALGGFLPGVPASAPDRDLRCRAALASTFVGGLELAREGVLGLEQEQSWQVVRVVRCEVAERRGASSMM